MIKFKQGQGRSALAAYFKHGLQECRALLFLIDRGTPR